MRFLSTRRRLLLCSLLLLVTLPSSVSSLAARVVPTSATTDGMGKVRLTPLFAARQDQLQDARRIRKPTFASTSSLLFGQTRRRPARRSPFHNASSSATTTALSTVSSGVLSTIAIGRTAVLRGGAVPNALTTAAHVATTAFGKLTAFVGASKTRCVLTLLVSILLEGYATTLSKQAKDTGRIVVFLHACALYLMWYVRMCGACSQANFFLRGFGYC